MNKASPQTENGYTKIANELLDALAKYRIPGEQRQCLDVIIRKTYGFHKKQDAIALSQFVEMTGLKKPAVVRAIKGLLSKKIIIVIKKDNKPAHLYEFNKHYKQWQPLSKKITLSKKIMTVIKKDNPSLSFLSTTKETTTKETITKEINTNAQIDDFDKFWLAYPRKKSKGQAKKTWESLIKKNKLPKLTILLETIVAQKLSKDWQKNNGKYIPYPSTWLNAEGWEDEVLQESVIDPNVVAGKYSQITADNIKSFKKWSPPK